MYIKTVGKPFRFDKKICKEALKFYGKLLISNCIYNKITVTLEFDASLCSTNDYAYCYYQPDPYNPSLRNFIISIDPNLSKKDALLALAHEIVHVKQYSKGELKDYLRANKTKWCGQLVEADHMDYWDLPWEIEAHGREKGMYLKFIHSQKTSNR